MGSHKILPTFIVMLVTYFIILTGYTLLNRYKGLKMVRLWPKLVAHILSNKVLCFDDISSFTVKWHTTGCPLSKLYGKTFNYTSLLLAFKILVLSIEICVWNLNFTKYFMIKVEFVNILKQILIILSIINRFE